ncbi:sigma-70 family RNA polymerase sigma factor [Rhizobiaceae bacterium n13]|uniref:Sigma-70 family RNA polymerase sigma factor n=1 Tax=Ferirhizobium litorale TaxID=2927786 RepID=A0AAE3QEF1_9HYPH|nr:sigma-70 family RNA polymerase sigma factor [Fererhizobium litorale]MDI7862323.1 sigma-70 family RNA polymerase sigma factor [Fererhizobium litorale]MDI7922403.1 sigma-70 family RNA polymerase sigma factor [Fererhizobium litorale]
MTTNRGRHFDVIGQLASLRRYARSLVRDSDDAEDLVHDALIKAYEGRQGFRPGTNVRKWLFSILHNTHVDRLRRTKALQRRHEALGQIVEQSMAASQDHSVRLRQVREAFFQLPEEQREALHLVTMEELSYEEAAGALGIPVGTLMSRISRARARLRSIEDATTDQNDQFRHLRIVGGTDDDSH